MSGHMVEVEIVGVGAFIAPASGGRRRPYRTGAIVEVTEEVAERLIEDGVAALPGGSEDDTTADAGDDADSAQSSGEAGDLRSGQDGSEAGASERAQIAFNPDSLTIAEMLEFADENDLDLPEDLDTSKRDPVIEAIEEALEEVQDA